VYPGSFKYLRLHKWTIPRQINTEKRHFQPNHQVLNDICEFIVPMEICMPAKFYCFMATRLLRVNTQSCRKTDVTTHTFFGKSGITSALIETYSSFHVHFKPNKMPFPMLCYTNIFSTVMISKIFDLTFNLIFLKMSYCLLKKCVHVTII
jgi:hypothetical protein